MAIAFTNELLKVGENGDIPNDVAFGVFRDVLQDMIDEFSLEPAPSERHKRQRTEYHWITGRQEPILPSPSEPGKESQNMAHLISKCLTLGLDAEIDQIFTKIIGEANKIHVDDFHSHLLPFLKLTITLLAAQGTDLTLPRFRLLYQHTLRIYINRYVQHEPTPPKGWERPRQGCGCANCRDLDVFLQDPQKQQYHFSRKEKERRHIENRFGYGWEKKSDFALHTVSQGSPYTLVITKKPGLPASFKRRHKEWGDRCRVATKFIEDLGLVALVKLLDEQYDAVMGLTWVFSKAAHNLAENVKTMPLASSAANIQTHGSRSIKPPAIGDSATSITVIDLTDEL
jgi:hypothetical protein